MTFSLLDDEHESQQSLCAVIGTLDGRTDKITFYLTDFSAKTLNS